MRLNLRKIWFPVAVVALAAAQTFGMDLGRRPVSPAREESVEGPISSGDTVIYKMRIYSKFRTADNKVVGDTTSFDIFDLDDSTLLLTARDTIFPPDSLRDIDPFRYRYYVALLDSLTHKQTIDSLRAAGDSLDWPRLDSLYYADSTVRARLAFQQWYASLDKAARKRYDFEQKMTRKQREMDSLWKIKDSIRARRDSIIENKPRVLFTFMLPDSLFTKRIVSWSVDPYFNEPQIHYPIDTSYNYYFFDYPFERKDLGATYLGTSGSPTEPWDYFKRGAERGGLGTGEGNDVDGVSFYRPLETYTYSHSTLPMWNTKTPYTELAYWGTLFANTEREESDLHILTTQNILPELNLTLGYDRFGANGMLTHEDTDNRTFHAAMNFIGKRYSGHVGYIHNRVKRSDNGGIYDTFWIRDTTVGSREIDIRIPKAESKVNKHTVFLDQTYRIPFTFIETLRHRKDSNWVKPPKDSLNTDITTAFIGHSSEYSVLSRLYSDEIPLGDSIGRSVYNNVFLLNPTTTQDSLRVMKLENKVFIRLQPWKEDAVVSSLNVGLGNRILSHYTFRPDNYLTKQKNTVWNSTYLYGGVAGQIGRGIDWGATGYVTMVGEESGDFGVDASAKWEFYPFRRARKSPVTISARFSTSLDEPEYFQQYLYTNHHAWDNSFDKISQTKIQGRIDIPYWKASLEGGFSMLKNNIYYDSLGVHQNPDMISVAKVGLSKNFKAGPLHLDNRVLVQFTSDKDVLPLPTVALNLRWYFQLNLVKDVMQMQLGANMLYTTEWYMSAYDPSLGVFMNQHREKYGNAPYINAFVNIQWKRACIFVKLINANLGWPMDSIDYFSADRYIRSQRAVKFGIYWPFYLQPHRNASVSGKAGSSLGGSGGGSRSSAAARAASGFGGSMRSL